MIRLPALAALVLAAALPATAQHRLLVLNKNDHTMSVVDPATASEFSRTVARYDPAADKVDWVVGTGQSATHMLVLSPDGSELWVGQNGDGGISIIDTATNAVKESFKVGELPIRLKFTPDGRRVVVSDPRGGAVVVVDAATRKDVKRIPMEGIPLGIQMAPDGKRAFIARAGAGRAEALDLDTLELTGSAEVGKGPDGLAYAVAGGGA